MDEEAVTQCSWNTCLVRLCLGAGCWRAWSGEERPASCALTGAARALGDASTRGKTALQL